MKKTIALILTFLIITLSLASCHTEDDGPINVCGNWVRENERYHDTFRITLNENGTFTYYETFISSYIGIGYYSVDGNLVTLIDEGIPGLHGTITHTYKFRYADGKLIFLLEESDSFIYIDLPDGAEFSLEEASDAKSE